ncbi:winged helix-turn-helix transcriptional regulator [Elusimicrobiota bacterium]
MIEITPKELKVINSIGKNNTPSQRDIAKDVGLSLGLTNILINRLIKKGYVKASKLNAKKVSYMITPKGIKQKAEKSYRFMKRSFSVINDLKGMIVDFAVDQHNYTGKRRTFRYY